MPALYHSQNYNGLSANLTMLTVDALVVRVRSGLQCFERRPKCFGVDQHTRPNPLKLESLVSIDIFGLIN